MLARACPVTTGRCRSETDSRNEAVLVTTVFRLPVLFHIMVSKGPPSGDFAHLDVRPPVAKA